MSTVTNDEPLASSTNLFDKNETSSSWLGGFISAGKHNRLAQLLVALLAFQLLLSIVLAVQSTQQGNFATGEPLLSTSADDISKIEISDVDNTVTLVKEPKGWLIDGEIKLPVQANKVENILDTMATLKPGLPVANSEAARSQLKVDEDDFMRRVSISGDEMKTATLMIGTSPGLRKSHLRRADANEIYSASLPASDLPTSENDWFDKNLLSFSDVISVKSNDIRFSLTGEDDKKAWTVAKPSDESRNIDIAKFEAVVAALQSLRANSIADAELKADADESTDVVEIQIASDKPETKLTMEKTGDVITVKRDDIAGMFTLTAAQFEQISALAALDDFLIDKDDAEPNEEISDPVKASADN